MFLDVASSDPQYYAAWVGFAIFSICVHESSHARMAVRYGDETPRDYIPLNPLKQMGWLSIGLLWGSGLWIFLAAMGGQAGGHVYLMMATALVMTLLFVYLWFVPFRHLKAAVARSDWPAAGAGLARIRQIILTNLILGLVTAVAGAAGRFL